MPIKPENRDRYPANWSTEIRPAILARAKNHCEKCGVKNGEVICREMSGETFMTSDGYVFDAENGDSMGRCRLQDYPGTRFITVVLTVAHLDHTPENCDPDNLRAWCQRCHLRYDAKHHAETAASTRRTKSPQLDLIA